MCVIQLWIVFFSNFYRSVWHWSRQFRLFEDLVRNRRRKKHEQKWNVPLSIQTSLECQENVDFLTEINCAVYKYLKIIGSTANKNRRKSTMYADIFIFVFVLRKICKYNEICVRIFCLFRYVKQTKIVVMVRCVSKLTVHYYIMFELIYASNRMEKHEFWKEAWTDTATQLCMWVRVWLYEQVNECITI